MIWLCKEGICYHFRDCFALSWQRFILDQQLDNEIKFKNINHMILSPLCSRVIQKQLNSFVGLSRKLKRRMAKHTTLINTLGWILRNRGSSDGHGSLHWCQSIQTVMYFHQYNQIIITTFFNFRLFEVVFTLFSYLYQQNWNFTCSLNCRLSKMPIMVKIIMITPYLIVITYNQLIKVFFHAI